MPYIDAIKIRQVLPMQREREARDAARKARLQATADVRRLNQI